MACVVLSIPSSQKKFDDSRMPCTLIAPPCVCSVVPLVAGSVPGTSRFSCRKLRPFSGSSVVSLAVTTVPTVAVLVCTIGSSAVTTTSSLICPRSSVKSARCCWFTCSVIGSRTLRLKPCNSALTRYVPGGSSGTL